MKRFSISHNLINVVRVFMLASLVLVQFGAAHPASARETNQAAETLKQAVKNPPTPRPMPEISHPFPFPVRPTSEMSSLGEIFAADSNQNIGVRANEDQIEAYGWDKGTELTATIKSKTGDLKGTATAKVDSAPWDNSKILAIFALKGKVDIIEGDVVTVTDGNTSRDTIVTRLEIKSWDTEADTVSGTAENNAYIYIYADNGITTSDRKVQAYDNGDWIVEFGKKGVNANGQESEIFNLTPGSYMDTSESEATCENGCDWTAYSINIPNPRFSVSTNNNQIHAWDWKEGTELTANIYSSGEESGTPDATATATVGSGDSVDFELLSYTIKPRYLVTVSGLLDTAELKKSTIVTGLTFTSWNASWDDETDTDTVSGTATSSKIDVWACDKDQQKGCYGRNGIDVVDGEWTADWTGIFDLTPGTWVDSFENEAGPKADGDGTQYGKNLPNPRIEANYENGSVQAIDWPEGEDVTFTIKDEGGILKGDPITEKMVENPNNPNETRVEFNVGNYGLALEVGFSIEVSGADISKTLTLVDLGDLTVEVKENTVTGGYPEDKTLSLWLDYYGYGQVMIESEAEGAWTVDTSFSFSQPLGPGSQGRFSTQDSDGDVTFIDWTVLTPKIDAWYQYNNIYANGWPEGETVTLHIDDGSEDGIEGGEKLVEPNPWNPSDTQAQFNLNGNTTLEPGMVLTVTDGTTSRSLTILALEVVEVNETSPESNPNRNTVKGTLGIPSDSAGTYLSDQKLWIDFNVDSGNEWCRRLFHAISKDADTGTWTVDYTETGVSPDGQICTTKDIVLGSSGSVMAPDSEENTTSVNWRMANPFIEARVNNKFIRGHDFPLGAMVQLATVVGEGDAEVETIIGNTKKVTEADWDSTQTIVDFDDLVTLTPGLKVRLTDSSEGGVTRDHTILADPGYVVDLVNDTISGTLNSPITAKSVNVNVNFDDINANRCADLEGSGNWSANFNTEPGNNGQGTLKLDAESRGDIWLLDNANCNGGSATVYNWVVRLDLTVNIKYAEGSNSSITNIVTSRVKNLPGSAVCKDPSCKTPHDGGAIISLTPSTKVGSGYAFQNWTGCDAVIGKACTVKLNAAKEVTATFTNAYLLTVTKTGNGTISAKNIYCGTDCSQPYLFNTKVTVSATADTGYTFTSWGGACSGSGSCEVAMTAAKSVSAVFAINTYKLTVTQNTDAGGTISRSPTGTDCGAGCQKYSYNTKVTLTAAPKTGWGLGGWSGACSGKNSCIVYVTSDKSVNADFFQLYGLTVNMAGTGKGSITRSAQPPYDASQTVTLTAVPTTGSTFTGWSGACGSISNNVCTVATNAAKTVTATFEVSKFGLTITKVGTGTVTGTGINCGTDCKETYNYNTAITIKAVPATGWTFAGWSGGGCSGKSITCWVKMTETRVVKATFAKKAITPKNR